MKKAMLLTAAIALALTFAVVGVQAEDAAAEAPKGVAVTVTGSNYCLLCGLAADKAEDAPEATKHLNGLLVTEVLDADGTAIEGVAGKTLHYVPTKSAEALLVGEENADAVVTVKGTYFADANAIVVDSFEASAGDEWDDLPIGGLSGQQVL